MIASLLIHGFTGSPHDLTPLASHLEQKGIRVVAPVLAGHHSLDALKQSRWTEWVQSAEEALVQLIKEHERVFLIGFSMGGLIAAHLATRYPVERLVLLSPPLYYPNFSQIFQDIAEGFRDSNRDGRIPNTVQRYLNNVRRVPIQAVWQFRHLVRNLKGDLPKVKVPTLIIQGHRDDVVHPRSAQFIYDTIGSTEKLLYFLPKSKHIVCHDEERDTVKELVDKFLHNSLMAMKPVRD